MDAAKRAATAQRAANRLPNRTSRVMNSRRLRVPLKPRINPTHKEKAVL